jgi:hypothetical protein
MLNAKDLYPVGQDGRKSTCPTSSPADTGLGERQRLQHLEPKEGGKGQLLRACSSSTPKMVFMGDSLPQKKCRPVCTERHRRYPAAPGGLHQKNL